MHAIGRKYSARPSRPDYCSARFDAREFVAPEFKLDTADNWLREKRTSEIGAALKGLKDFERTHLCARQHENALKNSKR